MVIFIVLVFIVIVIFFVVVVIFIVVVVVVVLIVFVQIKCRLNLVGNLLGCFIGSAEIGKNRFLWYHQEEKMGRKARTPR